MMSAHHADAAVMCRLGQVLFGMRRFSAAAEAYRLALQLDPHNVKLLSALSAAHAEHGLVLLRAGDYEAGWREYEHRWQTWPLSTAVRPASLPRWHAGDPAPRTILLHAEQGLGDTLQFCRYAPLVAARGHRVVLEVQAELVDLIGHSFGSDTIRVVARCGYPRVDKLPPVDAHCPLMSLPWECGTTVATIPSAPYLRADPAKADDWAKRLASMPGSGVKIGLVWAGNVDLDAGRSTTLAALAPLLSVPGTHFVSLQKGAAADELRASGLRGIYDADPALGPFADTAAIVANLDLVICVDTSVAHLVGAMGKPVWLLLRYDGCWRWLQDRSDSPWYPTMRIFRQDAERSWEKVIEQARQRLLYASCL